MIREGSYDTLHPPSPTTRPHQALVTTVKNKSAVDLKFSYAGISLYGKNRSVNLDPKDAADPHNSFQFPVTVPTRDAIKIVMNVEHVQRMLNVLDAQPQNKFRVWVAEPMERLTSLISCSSPITWVFQNLSASQSITTLRLSFSK